MANPDIVTGSLPSDVEDDEDGDEGDDDSEEEEEEEEQEEEESHGQEESDRMLVDQEEEAPELLEDAGCVVSVGEATKAEFISLVGDSDRHSSREGDVSSGEDSSEASGDVEFLSHRDAKKSSQSDSKHVRAPRRKLNDDEIRESIRERQQAEAAKERRKDSSHKKSKKVSQQPGRRKTGTRVRSVKADDMPF